MTSLPHRPYGTPATGGVAAFPGREPAAGQQAETLERLRAFVGPRWAPHYRRAFEKLLGAQRSGSRAAWTWNWCALSVAWFLYRRLYAAFAVLVLVRMFLLWPFIVAAAASLGSGSGAGLSVRHLLATVLFYFTVGVQCWAADRLLFDRALAAAGEIRDPARLSRAGRPVSWLIWAPSMAAFYLFAPTLSLLLYYFEPTPAPRPVVVAPLPPVAREVRSPDGRIALTVPHHWRPIAGLSDGAPIQVGNPAAEQYLVMRTERGDGLARGADAERHARTVVDGLRERLNVESTSDPRRTRVGSRPAARLEVLGTENGRRMMYFVASIEDERSFHTVMAWTPITGADSTRAIYGRVLFSFREYTPQP